MTTSEETALSEIEKCIGSDCLADCPSDAALQVARKAIVENDALRAELADVKQGNENLRYAKFAGGNTVLAECQKQLAKVTAERDAAVGDLGRPLCVVCKHDESGGFCKSDMGMCFEWRGVQNG